MVQEIDDRHQHRHGGPAIPASKAQGPGLQEIGGEAILAPPLFDTVEALLQGPGAGAGGPKPVTDSRNRP